MTEKAKGWNNTDKNKTDYIGIVLPDGKRILLYKNEKKIEALKDTDQSPYNLNAEKWPDWEGPIFED